MQLVSPSCILRGYEAFNVKIRDGGSKSAMFGDEWA